MTERERVDFMALQFLKKHGPDDIGKIETEEQFVAALVYIDLKRRGLVSAENPEPGVVLWNITEQGVKELEAAS